MLVVLELAATIDGGVLLTESNFQMLSFMPRESQALAVALAVGLFMALGCVMLLSLMQIAAVMKTARAGEEWSVWEIVDVGFDMGQVIVIVYYGIAVLNVILNAEVRSGELVQGRIFFENLKVSDSFVALYVALKTPNFKVQGQKPDILIGVRSRSRRCAFCRSRRRSRQEIC